MALPISNISHGKMASAKELATKNASLRDAVFSRYTNTTKGTEVSQKFGVKSRAVEDMLRRVEDDLNLAESSGNLILANRMKAEKDKAYSKTKNVYRLISKLTDAKIPPGEGFTDWELKEGIYEVMTGAMQKNSAMFEYGITNAAYRDYSTQVLARLGKKDANEVKKEVAAGNIRKNEVREAVDRIKRKQMGRPTHFTPTEEAVLVANVEMKNMHGCSLGKRALSVDIAASIDAIGRRNVKRDSTRRLAKRMLNRVNAKRKEALDRDRLAGERAELSTPIKNVRGE